jgi:hypothetical protein
MNTTIEIIHGEIITQKITRNCWIAKCDVTKPFKATVEMKGVSAQDAINKLKKFFEEQ